MSKSGSHPRRKRRGGAHTVSALYQFPVMLRAGFNSGATRRFEPRIP